MTITVDRGVRGTNPNVGTTPSGEITYTNPGTSTGGTYTPAPTYDTSAPVVVTPLPQVVDAPSSGQLGTLKLNLNLSTAYAGGITAPGMTVIGGPAVRIRPLGGIRLNSDPNSVWFRFESMFETGGRIEWTLLPPKGVDSTITVVESTGQEIFFPVPEFGLYKLVATARDNNGKTITSYTQIAVITQGGQTAPPFDTKWTGSTVVTEEPVVTPTDPTTPTTPTTPVVVPPTTPVALGTARNYSSQVGTLALGASLNAVATQLSLSSVAGLPSTTPFTLLLDYGQPAEEIVTVTSVSGTNLTVLRGEDGSSALAHSAGAVVRHGITARDLREPQAHLTAGAGVHGVAGNVVGTTDAQTLTGKTMDGGLNSFRNIPASALGSDIVSRTATQELTAKTLDGSKNTFKNIPQSAITGGTTGQVTLDGTGTFSNKTLDGNLNTFRNIPASAVVGGTSTGTGGTAVQPRHWYLNGYAWMNYTSAVYDSRNLVLFQTSLGQVEAGYVTIHVSPTLQVTNDCRVDFVLQAGAAGAWPTRRTVAFDGSGFGAERIANLGTSTCFYWGGGVLSVRGYARRVVGVGGWKSQGADAYCEVLWSSSTSPDNAAVNTAFANQTA